MPSNRQSSPRQVSSPVRAPCSRPLPVFSPSGNDAISLLNERRTDRKGLAGIQGFTSFVQVHGPGLVDRLSSLDVVLLGPPGLSFPVRVLVDPRRTAHDKRAVGIIGRGATLPACQAENSDGPKKIIDQFCFVPSCFRL